MNTKLAKIAKKSSKMIESKMIREEKKKGLGRATCRGVAEGEAGGLWPSREPFCVFRVFRGSKKLAAIEPQNIPDKHDVSKTCYPLL